MQPITRVKILFLALILVMAVIPASGFLGIGRAQDGNVGVDNGGGNVGIDNGQGNVGVENGWNNTGVGNGSDNSAAGTTTIVSSPKGISLLAGSATSPGSKDGSLRVATFFEPGRMTADSQFACGQLNYGVGGIGRRWIARGLIFCHEHNNGRKGGAFVTVNK